MMLELHNVIMKQSNVRKSKGATQCDKRTITCEKNIVDVMLVLFNMTIEPSNLKKIKIKELLSVTKELSDVILKLHNVIMEPSNVRKKKGNYQM